MFQRQPAQSDLSLISSSSRKEQETEFLPDEHHYRHRKRGREGILPSNRKTLSRIPRTKEANNRQGKTTRNKLTRIFATFGLQEVVVTDNGRPSLVSDEFEAWLKRNGIRHKTSPPYHPATNCSWLAEHAVQTEKRGVKKMKSGTLSDKIARFLFACIFFFNNNSHKVGH